MSDSKAPSVVTGPVTLTLDADEIRMLLQHLDFSVRQGGIQHARSALPLSHKLELAAINAATKVENAE